tara:strand:- start:556 stop:726 length:171 start_codon:yes stop_codon:yes gene_type:complete
MAKSKGLGDDIAKLTAAVKLDKLAEQIATALGKKDCGCKTRQDWLNDRVPYNKDTK